MKKSIKIILGAVTALVILCGVFVLLVYLGVLRFNHPSKQDYPVRGVDVSAYQGDIDWQTLSSQDIQFAFIKATEGSSSQDPLFEQNWMDAPQTKLRIGAYHFFSFESSGSAQADNFIQMVPTIAGMLPPVVDVEFYGAYKQKPAAVKTVQKELVSCLDKIEQHYGKKPILYATQEAYHAYLEDAFDSYDLWIRDVLFKPNLGKKAWTIWQYSDHIELDGYSGEEKYIDMNVFYGTQQAFQAYGN